MNITIRINDELAEEIEKKRGNKPKSDFYREILEQYLLSFEDSYKKDEGRAEILKELELKNELLKSKDMTIKTLENEVGFLIQDHTRISGQLDRLLMPSPEEVNKKAWWEFWK